MMVSHRLYWTLWLFSCFRQYFGQDLQFPEPANGVLGERVEIAPENPPSSTSIQLTQWSFTSTLIITVVSGVTTTVNPAYEGRVSFDTSTFGLELRNLTLDDSGKYELRVTTTAGGSLTGETSLQVFERISNVRLIGPEELLIERNSSANITSAGTGDITSVLWMKDNSPLSPSNRTIFSSDNRSVSISPVQSSDSGEYQCTYRNPASFETAKLSLIINYGPEDVSIKGPEVVDLGDPVSLSCSANSTPSASFSWRFNGTNTTVTTHTFTIKKTNFTDSGDYECTASNSITKRSASQSLALLVKEGDRGVEEGLTTGAIVGIVIGVLVAVAGICGLIFYLTKTKKIPKLTLRKNGRASGAQRRQEPELNYADISHFQKAGGERVILGSRSEPSTEYAEVKPGAKSKAPPPPYGSQVSDHPSRR